MHIFVLFIFFPRFINNRSIEPSEVEKLNKFIRNYYKYRRLTGVKLSYSKSVR